MGSKLGKFGERAPDPAVARRNQRIAIIKAAHLKRQAAAEKNSRRRRSVRRTKP